MGSDPAVADVVVVVVADEDGDEDDDKEEEEAAVVASELQTGHLRRQHAGQFGWPHGLNLISDSGSPQGHLNGWKWVAESSAPQEHFGNGMYREL